MNSCIYIYIYAEQLQSHVTQKGATQHVSCEVSKNEMRTMRVYLGVRAGGLTPEERLKQCVPNSSVSEKEKTELLHRLTEEQILPDSL